MQQCSKKRKKRGNLVNKNNDYTVESVYRFTRKNINFKIVGRKIIRKILPYFKV